jgi:hypothetical protein
MLIGIEAAIDESVKLYDPKRGGRIAHFVANTAV